ncbi:MFS transporter [Nocardia sp. XZ_19_385]|uniref:MFS transporter n=1 Tax=Nocardia sp. XZ_19_385 TaxID=2769488 RepID=UPI00188E0952|nr:MFS transporter [Nocardia sp. XZ_19_385]
MVVDPDTRAAQASSYRWVILLIATVTQAGACFFVQGIGAIGGYIQNDLHLSSTQLGLLVSAAQLVPILGLLAAGELLDRYSERLVVGVGTVVVAVALLLGTVVSGYTALLLVLVLVGAGYSTAQPGGSKSVAQWFGPAQRGFAMGIRQAGLPLGGAIAALTLPIIAVSFGWQACFLAGGLVALAGACIFIYFYRSPGAPKTTGNAPAASIKAGVGARLAMVRSPSMVRIAISGVALIAVQWGVLVFTVPYLHSVASIDLGRAALVLFVAQVAGVAGRILLAAWSDRSRGGRYIPVLTCLAAVSAGLLMLIFLPLHNIWIAAVLLAWIGFFGFGWYGPWVAYVAESAPPDKTGFALGLAMAINQIFIVAVPPALGLLNDMTDSYLWGWAGLMLASLVAMGVTLRKRRIQ